MLKRFLRTASFVLLCAFWVLGAIAAMLHHVLPEQTGWSDRADVVVGKHGGSRFILVLNDWSSQSVFTHIVGQLLESYGQPVAFVQSDSRLQFDLLANGDAHFQVEVWHNRMRTDFERALDRGVVSVGEHALRFRDGWWVSDATLAACPAAGDWDGFAACARAR
ncbi:MAG: glycine betaine ABC transporter substrate-binding protein, partial [Pseudomonadota bacterium]